MNGWKKTRNRMLATALALFMIAPALQINAWADGGGAVVTNSVDFDVLLNVDPAWGVDPNVLAGKVGEYLDQLISIGEPQNGDKTYRINTTAAQIDPTDLTLWNVYDHYDTAWYANQTAWQNNYANDINLSGGAIPSSWNYYTMADAQNSGNNAVMINGVAGKLTLEQMFLQDAGTKGQTAKLREHIFAYKDTATQSPVMLFYGYGVSKYADFLYYPASNTSTKNVKFDVLASNVQPHSLRYAGFLINAGVENGKISGYLLLLSYGILNAAGGAYATTLDGTYFYKLDQVNVDTLHDTGLHNASTTTIAGATNLNVPSFSQNAAAFWPKSHIELEITPTHVKATMQQLDALDALTGTPATLVDSDITDTGFGGFGPYVDYAVSTGHSCTNTSSFRFSNLGMSFVEPLSGESVLEAYKYADYLQDSGERFFINLTNPNGDVYTDTAEDVDLAYLSLIQRDQTVLLTDETWALNTQPVFPKDYLDANSKDVNNPDDVTDATIAYLYGGNDSVEILAAKLAWLIYHTAYDPDSGQPAIPVNSVVASLKLMDSPGANSNQVNEIKRELIENGGLAVYLDASGSSPNSAGYDPIYTLIKPDDTEIPITPLFDQEGNPYFIVYEDGDWPAGRYYVSLQYDTTLAGVPSIESVTTLQILADTVSPAVTANVTNAAYGTVALGFANTPSAGANTYTSELVSCAFVVTDSAINPGAPGAAGRVSVDANNALGTNVDISSSLIAFGTYYIHAYLWDAAGNMGYSATPFTITALGQTLSGTTNIYIEIGTDTEAILDIINQTIPGHVTYAITSGGDVIDLANGIVTPKKYGDAVITATAAADGLYGEETLTITIYVVDPPQVHLAVTGYDPAGITILPSESNPDNYGSCCSELKYRKAGTQAWVSVDTANWDWDSAYTFDFSALEPETEYEVWLYAGYDAPGGGERDAEDFLTFRTPPLGGNNGTGGGTGGVTVTLTDPEPGVSGGLPAGDYTIVIKDDAGNIVAVVTHTEGGGGDTFTETIPGLPDGSYTIEITTPDGQIITDAVTIQNGEQVENGQPVGAEGLKLNLYGGGDYEKSTRVKVKPSTPNVMVSGLNGIYDWFKDHPANNGEGDKGITADENNDIVQSGSSSLIELVAESVDPAMAAGQMADDVVKLQTETNGQITAMYIDLTLWKTITLANELQSPQQLSESGDLLKITIPLPNVNGHTFRVYRVHENGPAEEIPQGFANRTGDGEYCEFDGTNVILYVKMFSLYSVTYLANGGGNGGNGGNPAAASSGNTGWDEIIDTIKGADPGDTVTVGAGGNVTMPGSVIDAMAGNPGVTVIINWDGGDPIVIPPDADLSRFIGKGPISLIDLAKAFAQKPDLIRDRHIAFIKGRPGNRFDPEADLTRAEVAAIFARLTEGFREGKAYACGFKDVKPGLWYAGYIGFLEQYNIVTGYSDETFCPDKPITRAEFLAIATRYEEIVVNGSAKFPDVPASYWAYENIIYASEKEWITGYPDGTMKPDNNISRTEAVVVVCRILDRLIDQSSIEGCAFRDFDDINPNYWGYYYIIESALEHDYTRDDRHEHWKQ